MSTDWRLPRNRREGFQRFYTFHLKYRSHPGCVYSLLPAIAEAYDLDEEQRAWLVWLNGNTQNVVTSLLLLEAAPRPQWWRKAVQFWDDNFKLLEWDTDRRHQKGKFGEATEAWWQGWGRHGQRLWTDGLEWGQVWAGAHNQPYMGRLSTWSMIEYARILFGTAVVPDADSWLLNDVSGSQSHRNGLAVLAGYEAAHWDKEAPKLLGLVEDLTEFADDLLAEAQGRNLVDPECACPPPYDTCVHGPVPHPDLGRLTMESALCTYKGWYKPNRRYPNVYVDMMHGRITRAEAKWGDRFQLLWDTRAAELPEHLLLERSPRDPGLVPLKQNWFLNTGQPIMMGRDFPDMMSDFERDVLGW